MIVLVSGTGTPETPAPTPPGQQRSMFEENETENQSWSNHLVADPAAVMENFMPQVQAFRPVRRAINRV